MDVVSQFIVDLSWGLTFGALIAVGWLAGEAVAVAIGAVVLLGLALAVWRRLRKAGKG